MGYACINTYLWKSYLLLVSNTPLWQNSFYRKVSSVVQPQYFLIFQKWEGFRYMEKSYKHQIFLIALISLKFWANNYFSKFSRICCKYFLVLSWVLQLYIMLILLLLQCSVQLCRAHAQYGGCSPPFPEMTISISSCKMNAAILIFSSFRSSLKQRP